VDKEAAAHALWFEKLFSPAMELRASILAGAVLAAGFGLTRLGAGALGAGLEWLSLGLGLVYGGRAAWEALRQRKFDIDVLMVVAAVLAGAMNHPEDGALLLFLFVLSGALEQRAMERTRRAVEALHRLIPETALVRQPSAQGGGEWREVAPAALAPGDRVMIRSGERVPADSRIDQGSTTIDQSTLTGESVPREAGPGDEIYAGTLNVGHPVEAQVLRPASESSLQKILNLVISAQQQREPMQRAIDRLSQPYAIGVMAVSTAVLVIWWGILGAPLIADAGGALHTAIALLIVGSPCALVIATPTATLAAISRAARAGLLFKGGQAIERLARLGSVCLDKTGTLTLGKPRLRQVHPLAWSDGRLLLGAAAGLEAASTHPIAVAVVEGASARGVAPVSVADLRDLPGKGLQGVIDGAEARLGTFEHCEPNIPVCLRARVHEIGGKIRGRGQIGVVVAVGGENGAGAGADAGHAGLLILSDEIRPGARELVDRLHTLGVRPVRMLTGDHHTTAALIARALGVDQWDAELLPEDKVRIVREMKRGGGNGVGVIGDGVNDAPALAAADVSIAIGSIGSDAALESADIVLLSEDLAVIPWAVRLARRARAVIVFNLVLALSIIAGMAVAVLVGSRLGHPVPLPIAVIAHEGGTLLVVLNSLRLLAMRPPAGVAEPAEPAATDLDRAETEPARAA
jgi:Cd2+/Zn2+-exporting ATPase